MLDSVNLERRGIPSVVIVTEPFVNAAKATARSQGMADLQMVIVPHDYLIEDEHQIRAKLEPLVDEIIERLYVRASAIA